MRAYGAWRTEPIGPADILLASEFEEQRQLSFRDVLVVATAGVRIEDPFA